jgi:hypothetical protein
MKALNDVLKVEGYKKKNSSFYKHTTDLILIINLQTYGLEFFINITIWLKDIDNQEWPLYYKGHLRTRANHLTNQSKIFNDSLDYRKDNNDVEIIIRKIDYAVNAIRDEVVPYLVQYKTLDDIRNMVLKQKSGIEQKLSIHRVVWNYFGISWEKEVKP